MGKAALHKRLLKCRVYFVHIRRNRICKIVFIFFICFFIAACKPIFYSNDYKNESLSQEKEETNVQNLTIPKTETEQILSVFGWFGPNTILYAVKEENHSFVKIMKWNIETNTRTTFVQLSSMPAEVSISPAQSYVFMSSSASSSKVKIELFDQKGKKLYSVLLPAYELFHEWNPYQEGVLFLTSFRENWTFSTYIINLLQQRLEPIDFPQPFAQWESKTSVMYLEWGKGESILTAPLMRKELEEEDVNTIKFDVIDFKKLTHILMIIQKESEYPNRATYSFYEHDNELLFSFSVPKLSGSTIWRIPQYDFIQSKKEFITFIEDLSASEPYDEKFDLVKFNWKTREKETIIKGMANEPLSCSNEGRLCLYGYQFDKIIDLSSHETHALFKSK